MTGKVGRPENIANDPSNIFYNATETLFWPTSRSYTFHFIIRSCSVHVQKVSDIFNLIVQEIERSQNVSVDSQKGGCIVSWIQCRCRRCRDFSCHYGYTTAGEQNHRVVSIDRLRQHRDLTQLRWAVRSLSSHRQLRTSHSRHTDPRFWRLYSRLISVLLFDF